MNRPTFLPLVDECAPTVGWCRLRPRSVSGFPLPCLNLRMPCRSRSVLKESSRSPKFSYASLHACHALMTPADLRGLTLTAPSSRLPRHVPCRRPHLRSISELCQASGSAISPTAYMVPCLRFELVVQLFARPPFSLPSSSQDSVQVAGWALPGRDFHPARSAKLAWRTRFLS